MSNKSPNNKELELTKKEFVKVEEVEKALMASEDALDEAV
ncbi:hypothetical protein BBU29805_H14 (plasmid) [Borreliella burgdorferi 29805]|nr:OMS28 family porin [Borreliella burgdorferi]ACO38172.1 hypothetical protein BBU29805_H14 [Borreliella burgdorferi 29805]MDO7272964.1 OMS28 family porin [Borreliella burgdorferi]